MRFLRFFSLLPLFVAPLFFGIREARASVDYCKVTEIFGRVEIQESGGDRWLPLLVPRLLRGGDKLRTFQRSHAELSASADCSGLMHLGSDSKLEVMGEDLTRFFLRRGIFFILREQDGNALSLQRREEALFQIFTPDMAVDFLQGGISLHVDENGTWLRVFSEHAKAGSFNVRNEKVFSLMVAEGFKLFMAASSNPSTAHPTRMHFADYRQWQSWVKECYDKKDGLERNFLAKD